jgi:hypothetical protein
MIEIARGHRPCRIEGHLRGGTQHFLKPWGPGETFVCRAPTVPGMAHIYFLIGFRNRMAIALDWLWSYLTYQRGARLITGRDM